ncbi:MAG: transglycosylase SLT domain-containing protein [bacterium]
MEIQRRKLRAASQQFEALFINYLLQVMRRAASIQEERTSQSDSLGISFNQNQYQEFFDWELAVRIAEQSPLGVARQLEKCLENSPIVTNKEKGLTPHRLPGFPNRRDLKAINPYPIQSSHSNTSSHSSALPDTVKRWDNIILKASQQYQIDPDLVRAVIAVESGGKPDTISPKGAKGLMQIMDSTATEMGLTQPFHPAENIFAGTRYLSLLLKRYQGDINLALAAYNAGPGSVDRYQAPPPFPETTRYVEKVKTLFESLKREKHFRGVSHPLPLKRESFPMDPLGKTYVEQSE